MPYRCRECNASIFFVRLDSGKSIPCDQPAVAGLYPDGLSPDDQVVAMFRGRKTGLVMKLGKEDVARLYRPHWATCTDPDQFRKV